MLKLMAASASTLNSEEDQGIVKVSKRCNASGRE
jgi:hypothetical protein